ILRVNATVGRTTLALTHLPIAYTATGFRRSQTTFIRGALALVKESVTRSAAINATTDTKTYTAALKLRMVSNITCA
ncbi:hypothetical protein, partial [Oligella urethralis]|uniref:hypothetical protein n=1 Tax=Oligella urethralis TaxID=90245 RepID=UPI0019553AE7